MLQAPFNIAHIGLEDLNRLSFNVVSQFNTSSHFQTLNSQRINTLELLSYLWYSLQCISSSVKWIKQRSVWLQSTYSIYAARQRGFRSNTNVSLGNSKSCVDSIGSKVRMRATQTSEHSAVLLQRSAEHRALSIEQTFDVSESEHLHHVKGFVVLTQTGTIQTKCVASGWNITR